MTSCKALRVCKLTSWQYEQTLHRAVIQSTATVHYLGVLDRDVYPDAWGLDAGYWRLQLIRPADTSTTPKDDFMVA